MLLGHCFLAILSFAFVLVAVEDIFMLPTGLVVASLVAGQCD
jgi:hypothetical protein